MTLGGNQFRVQDKHGSPSHITHIWAEFVLNAWDTNLAFSELPEEQCSTFSSQLKNGDLCQQLNHKQRECNEMWYLCVLPAHGLSRRRKNSEVFTHPVIEVRVVPQEASHAHKLVMTAVNPLTNGTRPSSLQEISADGRVDPSWE
ncbi:hypothetical protein DFH09DRAFT_1094963 [Mycena vulgaris]|nr:hypothetical protein DFH09DRAFT_1094963 [Mycena vulgaris]